MSSFIRYQIQLILLWDESTHLIIRRGQIKVINNSDNVTFSVNTNGNITSSGSLTAGVLDISGNVDIEWDA